MPVLALEEKIVPKSIIRHRPIGDGMRTSNKRPAAQASDMITPVKKRASRPPKAEAEQTGPVGPSEPLVTEWHYADILTQQTTGETSTRTRQRVPYAKPVSKPEEPSQHQPSAKQQWPWGRLHIQKVHPLLYLGAGMMMMIIGWMLFSSLSNWFSLEMDQLRYGYPRTYQVDAWVGHNEQGGTPSHFIALNLRGRIEIIEFPGGDASHARVFMGPQLYGPDAALAPVTLSFVDINGDHKPDMIVTFQNTHIVFVNDQGTFRPPLPSEEPKIEQALKHLSS